MGEREGRLIRLQNRGPKPMNDYSYSWMYVKVLNQLPGCAFSSYLERIDDHHMPPHLGCCPQPIQKQQILLLPRPPMHLSQNLSDLHLNPLIYSQCKFFQINLSLSSPNSLDKRAPGWWTCLSSSSPAAGGLDCVSQDPLLILANIWLSKPFQKKMQPQGSLFNKHMKKAGFWELKSHLAQWLWLDRFLGPLAFVI